MITRVKILRDDEDFIPDTKKWHLVAFAGDTTRTLCTGEALDGSSSIEYVSEEVTKNRKVTCKDCIDAIKFYKSIPL